MNTNKLYPVVINTCTGGFSLSLKALEWLNNNGHRNKHLQEILHSEYKSWFSEGVDLNIPRHHPMLVQCVQSLGKEASGTLSNLEVVYISSNLYSIISDHGEEEIITPDRFKWNNCNDF